MANKDLMKRNGDTSNLPVRREDEWLAPSTFEDMNQWMDRWNQWFNSAFGRTFDLTPFRRLEQGWGNQWNRFWPAVNVAESDNEYRVTVELPGLDQNDIDLHLSNDSLTIKGEKKEQHEDKGSNYYRMERSYGTFHRTIPLPQEVDHDNVSATFKNGVLAVTLPKLPEIKSGSKKIQIQTEEYK